MKITRKDKKQIKNQHFEEEVPDRRLKDFNHEGERKGLGFCFERVKRSGSMGSWAGLGHTIAQVGPGPSRPEIYYGAVQETILATLKSSPC